MKTKWTTSRIINIIAFIVIVVIVAFFALYFQATDTHVMMGDEGTSTSNVPDNLKPIDAVIPDSISHKLYLQLKDSTRIIRNLKNGDGFNGSSIQFGSIGTASSPYCDTCNLTWFHQKAFDPKTPRQYYIKLTYWKVKNANNQLDWGVGTDSVQFYVNHGQSYLRKLHIDKTVKFKKGGLSYQLSLVDVPVKFRYSRESNCLLIPVSKTTNSIMYYIITGFSILFVIFGLYLIAVIVKVVIDLSRGLAFTNENIWRLKFVAIGGLIVPVLMIVVNFLLKLIFYDYFTADVVLDNSMWTNSWQTIAESVIAFLLYRAFRQGKQLKEEQDLTI